MDITLRCDWLCTRSESLTAHALGHCVDICEQAVAEMAAATTTDHAQVTDTGINVKLPGGPLHLFCCGVQVHFGLSCLSYGSLALLVEPMAYCHYCHQ